MAAARLKRRLKQAAWLLAFAIVGLLVVVTEPPDWVKYAIGIAVVGAVVFRWVHEVDLLRPRYPEPGIRKQILNTGPIKPKHLIPKSIENGGGVEALTEETDRQLFRDFDLFAELMNRRFESDPWRLQDTGKTTVSNFGIDDGPVHGRRYDVFYNQWRIGDLEITSFLYDATNNPFVHTHVELEDVRILPFREITGFLGTIAEHVSADKDGATTQAYTGILHALLASVWDTTPWGATAASSQLDKETTAHFVGSSQLNWRSSGSAINYLKWRKWIKEESAKTRPATPTRSN